MDAAERWCAIPNVTNYEISSFGRVRRGNKILRLDGYRVRIFQNGGYVRLNVRQLVHQIFPDVRERELCNPGEEWKPIPGHESYEVSNQCRVRRLSRNGLAAKLLSVSNNNGYSVAYLGGNGQTRESAKTFYVEKAVLQLFPETATEVQSLDGEEWRDIRGYEGLYRISNFGRVLSLDRVIDDGRGRNRFIRSRIRASAIGGNTDYPQVELARDGVVKTISLHRLVAEAFVPNPLGLEFVHHKDEDKGNPRSDNLEWVTKGGNVRDWFDRRRVVVSTDTIETISAALAAGHTPAEILAALPRKRKAGKS